MGRTKQRKLSPAATRAIRYLETKIEALQDDLALMTKERDRAKAELEGMRSWVSHLRVVHLDTVFADAFVAIAQWPGWAMLMARPPKPK